MVSVKLRDEQDITVDSYPAFRLSEKLIFSHTGYRALLAGPKTKRTAGIFLESLKIIYVYSLYVYRSLHKS